MKYVRTKDELGILIEEDNEWGDLPKGCYFRTFRSHRQETDWKFADTIEELCDEFVFINKKDGLHIIEVLQPDIYDYKQFAIYGAIWTEWGLKYVAKMNNNGEFDLL